MGNFQLATFDTRGYLFLTVQCESSDLRFVEVPSDCQNGKFDILHIGKILLWENELVVSKNRGTPKSSSLTGFSIIKQSILGYPGTPIYGNPQLWMFDYRRVMMLSHQIWGLLFSDEPVPSESTSSSNIILWQGTWWLLFWVSQQCRLCKSVDQPSELRPNFNQWDHSSRRGSQNLPVHWIRFYLKLPRVMDAAFQH